MPDDSWNPKGLGHPTAAAVRDLRSERLRDRHGHHRNVAVRAATRRSGGDAVPVDVPRHGGEAEREEVSRRITQRSSPVELATPIEPKTVLNREERQRISTDFPYH